MDQRLSNCGTTLYLPIAQDLQRKEINRNTDIPGIYIHNKKNDRIIIFYRDLSFCTVFVLSLVIMLCEQKMLRTSGIDRMVW